jgi:hypothetical protein
MSKKYFEKNTFNLLDIKDTATKNSLTFPENINKVKLKQSHYRP